MAKGKLSEMKRPKTGGGPKPPSPSVAEQCILDCLEGRPSLEGIAGGIDTADPASEVCGPPSILKKKDESEDRSKPSSKKRKTTTQDLEEKTLTLEHEKMREEIQKIKLEREVLELKKSYYNLKVQMFVNEHPEVVAQILPVHEV
ncbi:uncharacterized protein LOC134247507 [Saccostrea cucullata]|uniref:uncharacterized protein LOC134247507 n=1 Tax=Saccostrea cuccullata TaxID=36930 RepID=UPI002ED0C4AE